jgi:alkylhydroperoxidase/carboxymuconolactone decarboxylase family protein YurZ
MTTSDKISDVSDELTVSAVRAEVLAQIHGVEEGAGLDEQTTALLELAVRACATTLDLVGTEDYLDRALDSGVTPEQVQEMLVLISGIGIHALLAGSRLVAQAIAKLPDPQYSGALTPDQEALRAELVGDGAREANTSRVAPGFLDNIVRLCDPEVARAIYAFRAAPFRTAALTALQKELIGIAVDTMPSHRFLPTLRLHVTNALSLGAGHAAIVAVLDIAGAAPPHRGVW